MDIVAAAPLDEAQHRVPCETCHGTGVVSPPLPFIAAMAGRSAISSSSSSSQPVRSTAGRGRRSSAPEHGGDASAAAAALQRYHADRQQMLQCPQSGQEAIDLSTTTGKGSNSPTATAMATILMEDSDRRAAMNIDDAYGSEDMLSDGPSPSGLASRMQIQQQQQQQQQELEQRQHRHSTEQNHSADLSDTVYSKTAQNSNSIRPSNGNTSADPVPGSSLLLLPAESHAQAHSRCHSQSQSQPQSRSSTSMSSMSSHATLPLFLAAESTSRPSHTLVDAAGISGNASGSSSTAAINGSATTATSNSQSDPSASVSAPSGSGAPYRHHHHHHHRHLHTDGSHIPHRDAIGAAASVSSNSSSTASSSRSASSNRPKLPPIKHLLDDIDDWPQARSARTSSLQVTASSALDNSLTTQTRTSNSESHHDYIPTRSPTPSHHHVFAKPAAPPQSSNHPSLPSPQHAPFRPYHVEHRQDGNEDDNLERPAPGASGSSTSLPAFVVAPAEQPAYAPADGGSSSSAMHLSPDERDASPAAKRAKREGSNARNRFDALSLESSASLSSSSPSSRNDALSNKLSRPSIAAQHNQADKYHSYFADAKVNSFDKMVDDGAVYDYGQRQGHLDDVHFRHLPATDEDSVVVTPSLEATRGAELEAAIHLAAIASGSSGGHLRDGLDRIYVTTSSGLPPRKEASQRALRPMGSYSDQSSYGTAPSLVTEASTFADSSYGGGARSTTTGFNRSPSQSAGFSTDETSEISPSLSVGVDQDVQQPHQNNNDPDASNTSINGTGKYFCSVCQKRFTRPSALAVHSHMHTGAKPFACMVCDRSFSVNSNLRRHMKTHTRDERVAVNQ